MPIKKWGWQVETLNAYLTDDKWGNPTSDGALFTFCTLSPGYMWFYLFLTGQKQFNRDGDNILPIRIR